MKTLIVSIVAASLTIAFADGATAGSHGNHRYRRDALEREYPYATPRQLQNERAYREGGYWEHDSNALIIGTSAWFEQKEREGSKN
jgi:hypothetical protein